MQGTATQVVIISSETKPADEATEQEPPEPTNMMEKYISVQYDSTTRDLLGGNGG